MMEGQTVLKDVQPNQQLTIKQSEAVCKSMGIPIAIGPCNQQLATRYLHSKAIHNYGIDFIHKENDFVDFDRDRLIFHMLSTQGPRIAKGDVNKDGLEDIYIWWGQRPAGCIVCTNIKQGQFTKTNEALLAERCRQRRHRCLVF